jgi:hypothetical protein
MTDLLWILLFVGACWGLYKLIDIKDKHDRH